MTTDERRKYLRTMKSLYRQADRKTKGQLLDEMEVVTEMHRKSLIRKSRRRERQETYGPDADDLLHVIDESFDTLFPEQLTPDLICRLRDMAAIVPAHREQLGALRDSINSRRLIASPP